MTVEPTIPLPEPSVTEAMTPKLAVAEFEDASEAATTWTPFVDWGAMKVAVKDPVLDVVIALGEVDCVAPSYLMVMLDDPAKPVPDAVMVVPPIPLVGLSTSEGITVKVV